MNILTWFIGMNVRSSLHCELETHIMDYVIQQIDFGVFQR